MVASVISAKDGGLRRPRWHAAGLVPGWSRQSPRRDSENSRCCCRENRGTPGWARAGYPVLYSACGVARFQAISNAAVMSRMVRGSELKV
jgi:hypothetical protein